MTIAHLRPLSVNDAPEVYSAFQSNADMMRQGSIQSLEDARDYVANLIHPESHHRPWAIANGSLLIGLVCVSIDEQNKNGWFWYWMTEGARGQGIMSRAAATIANVALDEWGLDRLELGHRVNNPASGYVARAAGFIKEGTERAKFLVDGERIDVDTYGRLKSDPIPRIEQLRMEGADSTA